MFKVAAELSGAVKRALLCEGVNIFIANGGVAGQRAYHFMLHIIPRDEGDNLSMFDLKEGKVDPSMVTQAHQMLANNLTLMMQKNLPKNS